VVYLKLKSYQEACATIKEMKTRAVGQVLLVFYTFLLIVKQKKGKKSLLSTLQKVGKAINATRPTFPFAFLTDMVLGWARQGKPLEEMITGFLERLRGKRIHQAEQASKLIRSGDTILTHCNVSGVLPLMGKFCLQQKKRIRFFVTETRPYLQGARLTAWELQEQGFDVTIITDSTVAYLMSQDMIDKVIVGADQLAQNGDIANKIGTYQIAILANYFNIPFYVLCPPAAKAKTGKDITIEVRPDKELLEYRGVRLAPSDAKGYYPAFDITPARLITKHIPLDL
jgi:methylthioribose-1-phosphate isomerase